jgi:hypothetical protein
MTSDTAGNSGKRRRLERVTAACDLCKKRKVKCDGEQPCAYCRRKYRSDTCTFTAPKTRGARSAGDTPVDPVEQRSVNSTPQAPQERAPSEGTSRRPRSRNGPGQVGTSLSPTISRDDHPEDTVVPLEGRILRDAQGKVIFVGDCAPLSFLQTVRHLIASTVDPEGLPAHSVRDSIIEVARPGSTDSQQHIPVSLRHIRPLVRALVKDYFVAVSGLLDLFEQEDLLQEMQTWASGSTLQATDSSAAVFLLVLAIGGQENHEFQAEQWFTLARELLLKHLSNSMNVHTVQGFALVAVYMLRAFQPNGAYLYFCKRSSFPTIELRLLRPLQLWPLVLPMQLDSIGPRSMLLSENRSKLSEIEYGRVCVWSTSSLAIY